MMGLSAICGVLGQEVETDRAHHLTGSLQQLNSLNVKCFDGSSETISHNYAFESVLFEKKVLIVDLQF